MREWLELESSVVPNKEPLDWDVLRAQFKRLANVFTSVEKHVIAEGRVSHKELDVIAKNQRLSELGINVLGAFLAQSDVIIIEDDGENVWLVRNPEYLVEEEISEIRELNFGNSG